MKADPVFETVVAVVGQQLGLAVRAQIGREHDAFFAERLDCLASTQRISRFRLRSGPTVAQVRLRRDFLLGAPAVLHEVIGDAAGNVGPVVPDITLAVARGVDGVCTKA